MSLVKTYVPIIKLRRKEIHNLAHLKDAMNTSEIIPLFEAIHRFKEERPDGIESKPSYFELGGILKDLPPQKPYFLTIYRNLTRIKDSTFADSDFLKNDTASPEFYEDELKKGLTFAEAIPVFSVADDGDLLNANDFVDFCHQRERIVGIRISALDDLSKGTISQLTAQDYLFIDLGEDSLESLNPSFEIFQDLPVQPHLIILAENHNYDLKTKDLKKNECDTTTLHSDILDDIETYSFISGAGDYCGLKNSLSESRPNQGHQGFANAIFYQRPKKGYLILRDPLEEGVSGFEEIMVQAKDHKDMIDSHAWEIINGFGKSGDWSSWNVAGLVHYIYQIDDYINSKTD